MREIEYETVPAYEPRALAWVSGELYDVAAGWVSITAGGQLCAAYGEQFDSATVAPAGDVVALLATTGTKALIFGSDGEFIREVNRSYYQAEMYRYPLALFTLPDGRTGLVHCPEEYNKLEVEDAVTGERLTLGDREPEDVFHSRLAVSASGRYLLSACWVWHPFDGLAVYDLHRALDDPAVLDSMGDVLEIARFASAEISGACFVDDDLVFSTSRGPEESDDLTERMLARWSIERGEYVWRRQLDETAGDVVPVGGDVLALYSCPRLYDGATGEPIAEWPGLETGRSDSSIVGDEPRSGPARVAVDQAEKRFAVIGDEAVSIVALHSN